MALAAPWVVAFLDRDGEVALLPLADQRAGELPVPVPEHGAGSTGRDGARPRERSRAGRHHRILQVGSSGG
jgi:hypothetical protein